MNINEKIEIIYIHEKLSDEEIENFMHYNFRYISNNTKVKLEPILEYDDEILYFNNLKRIFDILKNHKRTYTIEITAKNRELLKQSGLLNYPNINLIIYNNWYEYSKEEYLKEEQQLELLIVPIKNSNLSPYEKYLAIYNIVKQFKPYKENKKNKEQARALRYILNNEYIVCVGFAKLLTTLLDKVGIPSIEIIANINISKYQNDLKNVSTNIASHERNIVKIDDDKYNIHGYFVVDPTQDNDMKEDLYNNSTSTFDKRKESKRLEELTDEDLLLDFHNFEEYLEKVNFYLKRHINPNNPFFHSFYTHQKKIINAYKDIYRNILELLLKLDYPKYQELYNKYNQQIEEKINLFRKNTNNSLKEIEDIFSNFLTDYATYIIPLSNQTIDNKTILTAASIIKQKINKYTDNELQIWKKETIKNNNNQKKCDFPYTYNPNDPRQNYLKLANNEKDINSNHLSK